MDYLTKATTVHLLELLYDHDFKCVAYNTKLDGKTSRVIRVSSSQEYLGFILLNEDEAICTDGLTWARTVIHLDYSDPTMMGRVVEFFGELRNNGSHRRNRTYRQQWRSL